MRQDSFSDAGFEKYRNKESGISQLRQTDYWIVHIGIQASAHAFSDSKSILFSVQPRIRHFGYTDLMVDGAPSPHQSDTTLRWLIDRLRS